MNRIYKVIFSRRSGTYVVTSEVAKAMGKSATALGVVALATIGLPNGGGLLRDAQAQATPEAACTPYVNAGNQGSMYTGSSTCTNYINNTRFYLNSLSTATSTQVSSLSTAVSALNAAPSSLSTAISSLSTSTSTAVSGLSTNLSSLSQVQKLL